MAFIAAVGGGALMAYVTQARVSASEAERALRDAQQNSTQEQGLAELMLGQGATAAVLVDRNGRVVAMGKVMRDALRGVDLDRQEVRRYHPLAA